MGGINTYGYVGGNPVGFYDPYGLSWKDWAARILTVITLSSAGQDMSDGIPRNDGVPGQRTPTTTTTEVREGTPTSPSKPSQSSAPPKPEPPNPKSKPIPKGKSLLPQMLGPVMYWELMQEACRQGKVSGPWCKPENDSLKNSMPMC